MKFHEPLETKKVVQPLIHLYSSSNLHDNTKLEKLSLLSRKSLFEGRSINSRFGTRFLDWIGIVLVGCHPWMVFIVWHSSAHLMQDKRCFPLPTQLYIVDRMDRCLADSFHSFFSQNAIAVSKHRQAGCLVGQPKLWDKKYCRVEL